MASATKLTPRAYRLDPTTLDMLATIQAHLHNQAAPNAPPTSEVAALRHAIYQTYSALPGQRRKKIGKNSEKRD